MKARCQFNPTHMYVYSTLYRIVEPFYTHQWIYLFCTAKLCYQIHYKRHSNNVENTMQNIHTHNPIRNIIRLPLCERRGTRIKNFVYMITQNE